MTPDFIATASGIRDLRDDGVVICQPDEIERRFGAQLPRVRPARVPEMFGVSVVRASGFCRNCKEGVSE